MTSTEGQGHARRVWSASGLPALWHVEKREQARRTPNAAAPLHVLSGSWPQLTSKFWRCSLSMNRSVRAAGLQVVGQIAISCLADCDRFWGADNLKPLGHDRKTANVLPLLGERAGVRG